MIIKKLIHDPGNAIKECLEGFLAAHGDIVNVSFDPFFVTRKKPRKDKVAIISGGGSGHEPLHAGFIGTTDLTQYIMSAERGSKELAALSDGMHPAVLQAIGMVAEGAAKHATELAVCGEMAGDPVAAKALIGLGVGHLSMNASAIGKVKNAIRSIAVKDMVVLAEKAKKQQTAADARRLFS